MNTKIKILITFTLLFLIISCTFKIDNLVTKDEILILTQKVNEKKNITELEPESGKYKMIIEWLLKNQNGWSKTPASYSSDTIIKGNIFEMFILDNFVVINYKNKNNKYIQVLKKINDSEFSFLKQQNLFESEK